MTTPRDRVVKRGPPHIGLWDDECAEPLVNKVGGLIEYFNVKQLLDGGEIPWSEKETSTHYVVVVKR